MRDPVAPSCSWDRQSRTPPACARLRERDERLESLKALVGHLAHDINNSLVPLLGYATLIREEISPGESVCEYAAKLEISARKIESFLSAVLLAVRPHRRFAPKTVNLTSVLERTLDDWIGSLPQAAAISVRADLAPCTLWADESQWQQLFQHLLSNARFALASGGALEITLAPVKLSANQAADLGLPETDVLELAVEDHGCGMSERVLKRACEPFFTTRPKGQATGLGLTIVHSVIQLHGGQLALESTEGTGTQIKLWFPSLKSAAESGAANLPSSLG